jgi:hypothetical protein
MSGLKIAGIVIGVIVAAGLLFSAKDIVRYIRISTM